jgi:hypothetical protein
MPFLWARHLRGGLAKFAHVEQLPKPFLDFWFDLTEE